MRIFTLCLLFLTCTFQGCTSVNPGEGLTCLLQECSWEKGPSKERVALVIGNDIYRDGPDDCDEETPMGSLSKGSELRFNNLCSSVEDADDMTETLRKKLKFNVIIKRTNVGRDQMKQAMAEFTQYLHSHPNSIGLFYFSGHGLEAGGETYLIPARFEPIPFPPGKTEVSSDDLQKASVTGSDILNMFTPDPNDRKKVTNRGNIVIFDSCRNSGEKNEDNKGGLRIKKGSEVVSVNPGASIDTRSIPDRTLVAFATRRGTTADSGKKGENSPYTGSLLKFISKPDLSISEVFEEVKRVFNNEAPEEVTQEKQLPSVLRGEDPEGRFFDTYYPAGKGAGGAGSRW